jgi:uncharacterized protein with HEPN domain
MYDKELILHLFKNIYTVLEEVANWTKNIKSVNDFTTSENGMILLNAVYMKLMVVGEELKKIDVKTNGNLLQKYSAVPWKQIKGLRDIIAHHYFDIDAEIIFSILVYDLQNLTRTIKRIITDLENE